MMKHMNVVGSKDLIPVFSHHMRAQWSHHIHMQQNNLVSKEWHCGQWEVFFGLSSGPLISMTCMSIRGKTWTDALHAARFSCLTLSYALSLSLL